MSSDIEVRITEWFAAQPGFDAFELAALTVRGHGKRSTIEVLLDRQTGRITLDECTLWNRALSQHLEQSDWFPGPYAVEISSPGADRLLTRLKDFERVLGRKLKVRYQDPAGPVRECTGILEQADESVVRLRSGEQTLTLPRGGILQARQEIDFSKEKY